MEIHNILLTKEGIMRKIRKHREMNGNKNTTYQKLTAVQQKQLSQGNL